MKKARIDNFDFIRSIAAWMIVIYHFSCSCMYNPQFADFPFYTHANGVWGENTSVNIFFILSGASLYYNHANLDIHSLKKYYFDRFKGIFPLFYLIWFTVFLMNATNCRNLFYNGSPKSMILTLLGMDGYLSYRFPQNYYIIGEWFIGALVLLYIIYPILTWCMKHCKILTTLTLFAGAFSLLWIQPLFKIQIERNLIVCLFAFWLGMLFIEHKEKLSAKWIMCVFGVIALLFIFVKMPFNPFICAQFIAIGLFLMFYHLGGWIMQFKTANRFFAYTGRISYPIFLLQNLILGKTLSLFNAQTLSIAKECVILLVIFVLIYIFASIAAIVNKAVVNSNWFMKMQNFVYGKTPVASD
ncbi:MAG: acyltransferase [Lachnospiraceae bacterium]|nr:acyltransferase [Lachnospiraceae bacterium]